MRAVSPWVECGGAGIGEIPGIHDKIGRLRRTDRRTSADTAIIFGAHFRWDFLPYWNLLHVYFSEVADTLKRSGIRLFDHHSATLTHRYASCGEMRADHAEHDPSSAHGTVDRGGGGLEI
ncbi:MAG: hypothetical protein V8T87_09170 [Victivallales bacterium]